MPDQRDQASEVLEFWFVETRPRLWFAKDPSFDDLVQQRFLSLTRRAIAGELDAWDAEPTGALALVLLLDQFPRQIWGDSARAFAGDTQDLALSLRAVELGWLAAGFPGRCLRRSRRVHLRRCPPASGFPRRRHGRGAQNGCRGRSSRSSIRRSTPAIG